MTTSFSHTPVLASEVLDALQIVPDGIYIDGTLGGGGHSTLIAKNLTSGKLYGIDRDTDAIAAATARVSYPDFAAVHGNFHDMRELLSEVQPHGILLDLGVSSYQLDTAARGFSYRTELDGPLDMRMDVSGGRTAADIVNTYTERELSDIIFRYGEDKLARRIARAIVAGRPFTTTGELAAAIEKTNPRRYGQPHPAMRTFQALRIAVNDELTPLSAAIENAVQLLRVGGRIAVITFHSLEDRIIKQTFARLASPCICPRDIPYCTCCKLQQVEVVTRKPILPSREELEANPRAHSAKLRIAEKI
jgi:16S rRNA (cytosine1402-N4)-methyltransferase